jgi:hypothetical protein
MENNCKKPKPWELKKYNYLEWGEMNHDWHNESKLSFVDSYFFRYDNYIKAKNNEFIIKSVFGNQHPKEIQMEIQWWFNACIGVYSQILIVNN